MQVLSSNELGLVVGGIKPIVKFSLIYAATSAAVILSMPLGLMYVELSLVSALIPLGLCLLCHKGIREALETALVTGILDIPKQIFTHHIKENHENKV